MMMGIRNFKQFDYLTLKQQLFKVKCMIPDHWQKNSMEHYLFCRFKHKEVEEHLIHISNNYLLNKYKCDYHEFSQILYIYSLFNIWDYNTLFRDKVKQDFQTYMSSQDFSLFLFNNHESIKNACFFLTLNYDLKDINLQFLTLLSSILKQQNYIFYQPNQQLRRFLNNLILDDYYNLDYKERELILVNLSNLKKHNSREAIQSNFQKIVTEVIMKQLKGVKIQIEKNIEDHYNVDIFVEPNIIIEINGFFHYYGGRMNGKERIKRENLERLKYKYIDISQLDYKINNYHNQQDKFIEYLKNKMEGTYLYDYM